MLWSLPHPGFKARNFEFTNHCATDCTIVIFLPSVYNVLCVERVDSGSLYYPVLKMSMPREILQSTPICIFLHSPVSQPSSSILALVVEPGLKVRTFDLKTSFLPIIPLRYFFHLYIIFSILGRWLPALYTIPSPSDGLLVSFPDISQIIYVPFPASESPPLVQAPFVESAQLGFKQ